MYHLKKKRMKKFLLSFLFAIVVFGFNTVNAQCTPDPSVTAPGISPDSATNLPPAYVNVPYSTTMTANVPSDTNQGGVPVTITQICIKSVELTSPLTGFTWTTNTADNCFPGGTTKCLLLQATPGTPDIGVHNLIFSLETNASLGGMIPITQKDTIRYYRIVVSNGAGIKVEDGRNFFALQNIPNPFANTTEIHFNAPKVADYTFTVYNMIGEVVYNETISAVYGGNTYTFNGATLQEGIYFYKLSNGTNSFTQRMIIQR